MIENHPLENVIDIYILEKDMTKASKELYQVILKQYVEYLKEREVLYATTNDVKNFLNLSYEKNKSSNWIYNQITVLKGLYQYIEKHQVRLALPRSYLNNIMVSIQNVKPKKTKQKRTLSVKEAKQLLIYLKENRKHSWEYRDYALIYLMITTGIRSIEVRRAKRKDLKTINGKYVLYIQGKGRSFADTFVKLSN